jgi:hypothetical protein
VRAQYQWTDERQQEQKQHEGPARAAVATADGTYFDVVGSETTLTRDLVTQLPLLVSGRLSFLVFVLNLGHSHWTSLVVARGGRGNLVAFYSDSMGPQQVLEATAVAEATVSPVAVSPVAVLSLATVREVLRRSRPETPIDLEDVSSRHQQQQHGDLTSSGLFALSNAFAITELLRLGSPSDLSTAITWDHADPALLRSAFADAVDNWAADQDQEGSPDKEQEERLSVQQQQQQTSSSSDTDGQEPAAATSGSSSLSLKSRGILQSAVAWISSVMGGGVVHVD